ncbi:hypothetical protein ElyMa_001082300 [Elysia marginata]|uniref:Uncharacterized protein n=1 Tax=Elysia marginata TaxID=1093978 RepID=A0AAV4HSJ2_9GAST|nr:hypothetical protein ElyMa_001082300 [Elysia marginata]
MTPKTAHRCWHVRSPALTSEGGVGESKVKTAPHPPSSPTRGRRYSAPRLLRQVYPEEEDPSSPGTSR